MRQILTVSTSMPFFLACAKGQAVVVTEVDLELKLNALVNMVVNDPSFSRVKSSSDLQQVLARLPDERREEIEAHKAQAAQILK